MSPMTRKLPRKLLRLPQLHLAMHHDGQDGEGTGHEFGEQKDDFEISSSQQQCNDSEAGGGGCRVVVALVC